MATERELLTRVRGDIRRWIEGDHDEAEMYHTLMLLEGELSVYLRRAEDRDRLGL